MLHEGLQHNVSKGRACKSAFHAQQHTVIAQGVATQAAHLTSICSEKKAEGLKFSVLTRPTHVAYPIQDYHNRASAIEHNILLLQD